MWDFMKRPKPIKPVCQMQPTQDIKNELIAYKRLIIDEIELIHKRILTELSVTDPDSLSTLHEVIAEYQEVKAAIDAKLDLMQTTLNTYNDIHKPVLVEKYNKTTGELTLSIEVK